VQIDPFIVRFAEPLFFLRGTPITLGSLISVGVILALTWLISFGIRRAMVQVYRRRGVEEGVQYAVNRLIHYLVIAFGLVWAIDNLGVSITGFAALGALVGVGIGFGLQNIAQNFISGLILLLERPIKRGDFVVVGDTRGTVREIRARATVVTTLDNVDILVPNGQFISSEVVNQTFDDRNLRIRVRVGVAYGSDTSLVRETLERVALAHPSVLADRPAVVLFDDFGDSSLDFSVLVWVGDPLIQNRVASDLRFEIDRAFREAGVEIPFPQRDLHLRSGFEKLGAAAG
jgi:potassium-dependent mechanosensitive channel